MARGQSGAKRRWVRVSAAMLALGGGAVAGHAGWRWLRLPARAEAALPSSPDLTGWPTVLHDAIAVARARIGVRGETFEAVAELGRLYHANGFRREAEACWRWLRAEQSGQGRWSYLLADLRRSASDYEEMAVLLRQTVRLAPDYAPAWWQLAEFEFKNGDLDAAEAAYRRRLELQPGDAYARLGLARVALRREQKAEARRWVEQIVRDAPEFPPAQNLYAEMLAAEGDEAGARRHRWLGREAGRFREPPDPWLNELSAWCYDPERLSVLATIEYQTEQGDRGRAELERAMRLAPENATIRALLGELYLKLGDAARARDTLEEGTSAAAAGAPASLFTSLAEAYRALGDSAGALHAVQQGLEVLPEAAVLHNLRGVLLDQLGRTEEADAAFRAALARAPNDADANLNLGLTLLARGRREEGVAQVKRALEAQPTFPKALALLGRMELEAGQLEEAWRYLQPLYESSSGISQVRQLVAQWHWRAGAAAEKRNDAVAAERHYREGAALAPEHAELQASLGVLLLTQGRLAEALAPLETYRRLQPDNPQAALFVGQAYAGLGRTEEARRILAAGAEIADRIGNRLTAQHCREILQQLGGAR